MRGCEPCQGRKAAAISIVSCVPWDISAPSILRLGASKRRCKPALFAYRKSPPVASFFEICAVSLSVFQTSRAGNSVRKPCTARPESAAHVAGFGLHLEGLGPPNLLKVFLTVWRLSVLSLCLWLRAGRSCAWPLQAAKKRPCSVFSEAGSFLCRVTMRPAVAIP